MQLLLANTTNSKNTNNYQMIVGIVGIFPGRVPFQPTLTRGFALFFPVYFVSIAFTKAKPQCAFVYLSCTLQSGFCDRVKVFLVLLLIFACFLVFVSLLDWFYFYIWNRIFHGTAHAEAVRNIVQRVVGFYYSLLVLFVFVCPLLVIGSCQSDIQEAPGMEKFGCCVGLLGR